MALRSHCPGLLQLFCPQAAGLPTARLFTGAEVGQLPTLGGMANLSPKRSLTGPSAGPRRHGGYQRSWIPYGTDLPAAPAFDFQQLCETSGVNTQVAVLGQDSRPHDARTARQSAGDMTVLSTNGAVARLALICFIGFAFTTARSQPPDAFSVKVVSQLDLPAFGAGVAAAWSEDGSRVAVASQFGDFLTVWDSNGHRVSQITRAGGGPTLGGSIAFVAGSSRLVFPPPEAVPDSAAFSVWDIAAAKLVATVNGPQPGDEYTLNRADHFMTSHDESILAMATRAGPSWQGFRNNIAVFDTRSWRPLRTAAVPHSVSSLCLFGHDRLLGLGTVNSGVLVVLDALSGATMTEIRAYENSKYGAVSLGVIAGSPNGDLLLTGVSSSILNGGAYHDTPELKAWDTAMSSTEAVRLFRVKDGARVASFPAARGPIRQAQWDPKGRYVAFVDNNRGLFLWGPPWQHLSYKKIDLPTKSFALSVSPDGDRIVVTTDHGAHVYSLAVVQ